MKLHTLVIRSLVLLFALPLFAADPVRVACVGDSITFGAGIKDRAQHSYPVQLAGMLGEGYEVRNFGVNAATLLKQGNKPYWKQSQFQQAQDFQPHIVVIKLGTNDTKPGNWKHEAAFVPDYLEMVQRFQGLESHPEVYVCHPVPVFPERWGITDTIVKQGVIPKVNEVARQSGARVIDLYTPLAGKSELLPDKVHPNREGARILAQTVHAAITGNRATGATESAPFPGKQSLFACKFTLFTDGGNKVVVPEHVAEGKPWVWRARFWGHEPQFDVAMLEKGYHVVYCHVGGLYGNPEAVARWQAYYTYLTHEHGFAPKPILEGMSRGGLIIYNWAIAYPDQVAAIYGDAPVMDMRSWPGAGNKGTLRSYGFADAEEASAYTGYPIDNLKPLAEAGIPIIHVVGDDDKVVPVAENTAIAEARYRQMGGVFEVIHKPGVGHHPHSLEDPTPIVTFMEQHVEGRALSRPGATSRRTP